MDISNFRREYLKGGLNRSDLCPDPVEQFASWLDHARKTKIAEPTAMILATVNKNGQPSQRSVLLKYFDPAGFVFFTNYGSRKAEEIAQNEQVSLLLVWLELERQVMINGRASQITSAESTKYFLSRPKNSQVAAWVSSQSNPLSSRQALMQKFGEMKKKFSDGKIPLPSFWGGYRVVPCEIEFWQGRANRLHDRFVYRKNESLTWDIERLMP